MTFAVQDDTGTVSGANAYISVAYFQAYHGDRGNAFAEYSDSAIQYAIIKATDYLDQRFNFVGSRRNSRDRQTTEWPRQNARDRDRFTINNVPPEVKEATAEYALRALAADLNPDPDTSATGAAIASKTETVGPISESVTYVGGSAFQMPRYPAADQRLLRSGLVETGGRLIRG